LLDIHVYWNILTMHGPINVKSLNNTSKWQMGFNSAFKGLIKGLYLNRVGVSFELPQSLKKKCDFCLTFLNFTIQLYFHTIYGIGR
jgi:hypothetical protein